MTNTNGRLAGNYQGATLTSCAKVDYPTKTRIAFKLDGQEYERAIFERVIWRNSKPNTVLAQFVIVNGENVLLSELEDVKEV